MAKQTKKSTKAEIDQRVSEIADLLLNGYTRSHILKYASKWGVSDTQVDLYTAQAREQIKEINQQNTADTMALIASNLWDLYRKAAKEGDLSEQHKILNSIAKLKGLDQTTVVHNFTRDPELAKMSDADLEKALVEASQEKH